MSFLQLLGELGPGGGMEGCCLPCVSRRLLDASGNKKEKKIRAHTAQGERRKGRLGVGSLLKHFSELS